MIIRRIFAFFIDLVIAVLLSYLPFGFILAFFYILIKDKLTKKGSPGKNFLNLQVTTITGQHITFEESIYRNLILAFPLLFNIFPFGGSFIIMSTYSIICVIEILTMIDSAYEQRMGDRWANTVVREAPIYYHDL